MKKLIVVDFDKTLIPYDSFKSFVLKLLPIAPFTIGRIIVLRLIRIVSAASFKSLIIIKVNNSRRLTLRLKIFVSFLKNDLHYELIQKINEKKNQDTVILLLSASPDIYIQKIGESLKWNAKGSYFSDSGEFIHLWGLHKIRYLKQNFPKQKYEYNYCISDSISDLSLLREFKEYDYKRV